MINDPRVRGIVFQIAALALIVFCGYWIVMNARANLAAQGIASGFGFLNQSAGFDVNQSLIDFPQNSTYGRVFVVGLLNTLLVAVIGIFFATIIGFIVGIARLSKNWMARALGTVYVEVTRNLPPLFQIFFWYVFIINIFPSPL